MATRADLWDFRPDGTIRTIIGGKERKLRCPTIGEQRRFEEAFDDVIEVERSLADSDDRSPIQAALLDYWRQVITTLSGSDDLPDDDDLPPFLLNTKLVNESRRHWRAVPLGSDGWPSAKEQAQLPQAVEALKALQQVTQAST